MDLRHIKITTKIYKVNIKAYFISYLFLIKRDFIKFIINILKLEPSIKHLLIILIIILEKIEQI